MSRMISEPLIYKINDNDISLDIFENEIKELDNDTIKTIILDYLLSSKLDAPVPCSLFYPELVT